MAAVLARLGEDYDADVGLIAVDGHGLPVAMHRTKDMPHAHFTGDGPVVSRMRV
jgi:L-asparaginase / beta-aspartyl-peptidase